MGKDNHYFFPLFCHNRSSLLIVCLPLPSTFDFHLSPPLLPLLLPLPDACLKRLPCPLPRGSARDCLVTVCSSREGVCRGRPRRQWAPGQHGDVWSPHQQVDDEGLHEHQEVRWPPETFPHTPTPAFGLLWMSCPELEAQCLLLIHLFLCILNVELINATKTLNSALCKNSPKDKEGLYCVESKLHWILAV